jgi:DNA-binding CsgD family transcriptional regulator
MHALGVAALGAGDLGRAAHWAERLCEHQPEICSSIWQAQTILVAVALARDDSTQARIHIGTLLAAARPLKNRWAQAIANLGLARAALLDGDDRQAESIAHDALKVLTDHGWRPAVIDALDVLAEVALFRRQHQRAVRLAAAAGGQRSALGVVAFPQDRNRTERQLADAGAALGDENLKKAYEEGMRLSLEEAVAYAQRGRGAHAGAMHGWTSLSPVERQVTELASRGMSNPDIGQALLMSRNTVKVHLSHVYAKLGVANRAELARSAARHWDAHDGTGKP